MGCVRRDNFRGPGQSEGKDNIVGLPKEGCTPCYIALYSIGGLAGRGAKCGGERKREGTTEYGVLYVKRSKIGLTKENRIHRHASLRQS